MLAPLILVSSQVKNFDQYYDDLVRDLAPRVDYMEVCKRLEAEVSGYGLFQTYWYALERKFDKLVKLDFFESIRITKRISQYNAVLSASEKTALPLSMFLSLSGQHIPHVVISHHLSSKNKSRLFRIWQVHKTFNHVICVSQAQRDYAVKNLHIPALKAHFIYDKVDHGFFRPMEDEPDNFVLAVGQEQRDYNTLYKALSGTGIKIIIVASSNWSTYRLPILGDSNAEVVRNIPYTLLRSLYARARLVVVPLNNVCYAAGSNTILEAMAMGKPVVVTNTPGIREYIQDGETGLFVSPGDSTLLRETILSLWDDEPTQRRLGANARQAVEEKMNLWIYVDHVTRIMQQAIKEAGF